MSKPEQIPGIVGELRESVTYGYMPMRVRKSLAKAADHIERLTEALTPSCETKAAFMGEFSFTEGFFDEDGEEHWRKTYVPWTTVKEIMAAIQARAARAPTN